jgi:hypothetical protein
MDTIINSYNQLVSSDDSKFITIECLVKNLNIDALLTWINTIKPVELNSIPFAWLEHRSTVRITLTKKHNGIAVSIE